MEEMFACDQFDYNYKTKTKLSLANFHQELHAEKKFICNECSYQTSFKHSSTRHKQAHHEGY